MWGWEDGHVGVGDVHMEVEGCACVERFPTLHNIMSQSYSSDITAPHTLVSVSGWYSSHSNRSCLVLRDSELMHTAGKHWEAVVGIQHSQCHLEGEQLDCIQWTLS